MRGGTSKAVFLKEADLPAGRDERDRLILRIFGSPDRRQIDGGQSYLDFVVVKFGPQRIEEATYGEFGATIDRLQGHGAIGEGGPDANDRTAIARAHVS